MVHHLFTLVWLKAAIIRHSVSKGGAWGLVAATLFAIILGMVAFAIGAGLFVLGAFAFEGRDPIYLLFAGDGLILAYLFFWGMGLSLEIQRSEVIDFRKMLHLPVSLPMVFGLNYALSIFTPAMPFFFLPLFGLALGLSRPFGPPMFPAVFLLGLAFYFMLSAWTYYIRGFLAILMENKRRRRLIVAGLPLIFIALMQTPNLIARFIGDTPSSPPVSFDWLENAAPSLNVVIPLGWFPYGVMAVAEAAWVYATACCLGMIAIGAAGLAAGYRSTLRFYHGAAARKDLKKKGRKQALPAPSRRLIERRLPFLHEHTSAVALMSFLTYSRLPMARLQAITTVVIVGGLILLYAIGREWKPSPLTQAAPPLLMVLPVFNSFVFLFNIFGADKDGFRALILMPGERWRYILGKNLGFLPITAAQWLALLILGLAVFKGSAASALASLLLGLQAYLTYACAGNLMSLYAPFRIRSETMRAQRKGSSVMLQQLTGLLLTPVLLAPIIICAFLDTLLKTLAGYQGFSLVLPVSAFTLLLAAAVYALSLKPLGRLLEHRETLILDMLLRDKE